MPREVHVDPVAFYIMAALNKNKLQKAFQLTEGKSIGEYIRALRMELALELLEKAICPLATSQKQLAIMEYQISTISFSRDLEKRRKQSEYCFKTIRNSVIFIGCFHRLASNANIYMFCDFGRIAPAKMLVEGFPPSPQDRPHSVTAARPADAENHKQSGIYFHRLFPLPVVFSGSRGSK